MENNLLNSIIKINHSLPCTAMPHRTIRVPSDEPAMSVCLWVVSRFGWKIYFYLLFVHKQKTPRIIYMMSGFVLNSVRTLHSHTERGAAEEWKEKQTHTHGDADTPNLQVFVCALLTFYGASRVCAAKWFGYLRYGCFGCSFRFSLNLPAFFRVFAFIALSWCSRRPSTSIGFCWAASASSRVATTTTCDEWEKRKRAACVCFTQKCGLKWIQLGMRATNTLTARCRHHFVGVCMALATVRLLRCNTICDLFVRRMAYAGLLRTFNIYCPTTYTIKGLLRLYTCELDSQIFYDFRRQPNLFASTRINNRRQPRDAPKSTNFRSSFSIPFICRPLSHCVAWPSESKHYKSLTAFYGCEMR